MGFPGRTRDKETMYQCKRGKRQRFDPCIRRPLGEGNGNPLLSSCLENPMDRGAWWATDHGGHKASDMYMGCSGRCPRAPVHKACVVWRCPALDIVLTLMLVQRKLQGGCKHWKEAYILVGADKIKNVSPERKEN